MSLARQRLTPQEYLCLERESDHKSEFYQGQTFAMAGANEWHNLIVANVVSELRAQFKGRPSRVFPSDMRIKVNATGLYTYPDVTALCGEADYEDEKRDTLLNPLLIVEVLSRSTESYDRGEKFAHYRRVDSVTDYVLISQDRVRVEYYSRQLNGGWLYTEQSSLRDVLCLASLNCQLPLSEIYDKVDLEPGDYLRLAGMSAVADADVVSNIRSSACGARTAV